MGASFLTLTFPGDKTRNQVKADFDQAVDQSRYEDGHSYSGCIGMATGLIFEDKTFDDYAAAENFLSDACEKWEEARCVTFLNKEKKATWLVAAMCAS